MELEEDYPKVHSSERLMLNKVINHLYSNGNYKKIELREYLRGLNWSIHEREFAIFVARIEETGFVDKRSLDNNPNEIYLELSDLGVQLMKRHEKYEYYLVDYTYSRIDEIKKKNKEEKKNRLLFRIDFVFKYVGQTVTVLSILLAATLTIFSISDREQRNLLEQGKVQLTKERDSLIQALSTQQMLLKKESITDSLKK